MPNPRQVHGGATRVLSLLMLGIGIALLVQAAAGSGGALVVRLLLGVLFVAAGIGRLLVESRRSGRAGR